MKNYFKNVTSWAFIIVFTGILASCQLRPEPQKNKLRPPNVLLIAIDDLNDWIGVLEGHPQAKTPNIDRLAAMGVTFTNALCQAPVCNPSRASMMTSLYPSTTGIYFLDPDIPASEVAIKNRLMPQRFLEEGYHVSGAGKLFHNAPGINERHVPNYAGDFGGFGPFPTEKLTTFPGHPLWDWGVFPEDDEKMPDHLIANWTKEQLEKKRDSAFWLGVGFYRPHVPQYVPQKWFDLYPIDSVQLPNHLTTDLEDISTYGKNITRLEHVHPDFEWVVENDEWKPLVQSYLACVSFVDYQVGKVLNALQASEYKDNTIVVLYSDHGFHLGEKERFAKRSLWEDGARVPLIIAGPGIQKGGRCGKPAQLLDIYPTLLELTGLKEDSRLEGNSLLPLLRNPQSDWPKYARTSFGPGNYAIVSEHYRFIQYNDGTEEFYDHQNDPNEWYNQIANENYQKLISSHRAQIPKERHPILGSGSTGHLSFKATEASKQ
ncbi:sulfatase [Flagellimonas sp. CMM7]|uniref:sulfatase n=1 Tax=Flagellimonas sp. CMM7 TaxID=2654676 RepID=UPI0013D3B09A|nr:sulfatase [Flagellimonas sp. CMM7]UII78728.1 sulfatase [Flagellimonas sp. CMM7]